jgi:hypothetical protein
MSYQVIRYDTELEFIEYTNHRRYLATGKLVHFADWDVSTERYWDDYHAYMNKHPLAVLEMWTVLHKERIDTRTGETLSQDCTFDTLAYETIEEGRASRQLVKEQEWPDPGIPVSKEFKTKEEASMMRAYLLQGYSGYYYDLKHRGGVAVVTRESKDVK